MGRRGWLWLLAVLGPVLGGLLATLSATDAMGVAVVAVGLVAVLAAAGATWLTIPSPSRVVRGTSALLVGLSFLLLVAPIVFIASAFLFGSLLGDDGTSYL
jgi:hypothetical protein